MSGFVRISVRDRVTAGIGTAAVIASIGYALLFGLNVAPWWRHEQRMVLIPLQPPPVPTHPHEHVARPRKRSSRAPASPRNLKAKAAEVVAPPVARAPPPPLVVARMAGVGMEAANGAATLPGPGEGAGGRGDGPGSGGYGTGDGGDDTPPRQIRGDLNFADLPPELRAEGFEGTVGVRYEVEVDGRVGACSVTASSGRESLDEATCRLIRKRFRFEPARDGAGRPSPSTIVETHTWAIDRSDYPNYRR